MVDPVRLTGGDEGQRKHSLARARSARACATLHSLARSARSPSWPMYIRPPPSSPLSPAPASPPAMVWLRGIVPRFSAS